MEPRRPTHTVPKSILKSPTKRFSPLLNIDPVEVPRRPEAIKKRVNYGTGNVEEFQTRMPIPTEIIHLIIRWLSGEKRTLQVCALISKEWLQCTRDYLFPRKFAMNIDDFHCDPIETIALLEHPLSTIGRYVYHLSVNNPSEIGRRFAMHRPSIPGPTLDYRRFLHAFASKCDTLRNLTVTNLDLDEFTNHDTPLHLRQAFPDLLMLDIRRCTFRTYDHLFSFIGSKHRLRHLALTDVDISEPDSQDIRMNASVPRNLRHLRIHTPGLAYVLDWLCSRGHVPSTKSMHIGGVMGYEDEDSAVRFFKRHGPFIERIKFYLGNWYSEIDLAVCTNLRELSISHIPLKDSESCAMLFDVLEQIRSTHLSDIKLHFVNRPEDFAHMDWRRMSTLLDTPYFSELRKLTIILNTTEAEFENGYTEEVGSHVEACFPRLHNRKILNLRLLDERDA